MGVTKSSPNAGHTKFCVDTGWSFQLPRTTNGPAWTAANRSFLSSFPKAKKARSLIAESIRDLPLGFPVKRTCWQPCCLPHGLECLGRSLYGAVRHNNRVVVHHRNSSEFPAAEFRNGTTLTASHD